MRLKYIITLTLILIFSVSWVYAAPTGATGDAVDSQKEPPKYFKQFKEYFYQKDDYLEDANPKEDSAYYAVTYEEGREKTAGYYTKEGESEETKRAKLTQNVNFEGTPFYYVVYQWDEKNKEHLLKKEFFDQNDIMVAYYEYIWNDRINQIEKIQRYGKTAFLNKMELKSYCEYKWDGDSLLTLTYYDKSRQAVEKYSFESKPYINDNTDEPFMVGNNRISMINQDSSLIIKQYDRYRPNSRKKGERSFYVEFKIEGEFILQEMYSHEGVLMEEKPPIQLPGKISPATP